MTNEQMTKFRKGDRVIVENLGEWCDGCHGIVKGIFWIPPNPVFYLVKLDESPYPAIQTTYLYEESLKKEEG